MERITNIAKICQKCFIYISNEFTWDNDCSKDTQRRIRLATAVFSEIQSTWKDSRIMMDVKASTSNVNSFPELLYAAETWTVNKEDEKDYLHLR